MAYVSSAYRQAAVVVLGGGRLKLLVFGYAEICVRDLAGDHPTLRRSLLRTALPRTVWLCRSGSSRYAQWHTHDVLKRVQETERLVADPAPGVQATTHEDNMRYFDVVISGPAQSPFEGTCGG